MGASKTTLLLFSSNAESSKFPKKLFWRRIKIFAFYFEGLAVFSVHKRALSTFKNVVKILMRCQSPFFGNLPEFGRTSMYQRMNFRREEILSGNEFYSELNEFKN